MPSIPNSATARPVAAIYARYSSDRQRDASIPDQIRLCKEMIARMGWVVGPTYVDRMISGSVAGRKDFQNLRRDVRRGPFQVVVAESFDRLTRDTEASANFRKQCDYARVAIQTCTSGAGKLVMGVKAVMDEAFLDELAGKTRRGLRGRIKAGASAGGLSYGYRVVAVPEGEDRGGRTIDPAQADVVRRIFRDYANGLSPKKIAAALNREGVPSPRGKGWSQSTINGNRARGNGILNNELYIGVLVWNRLHYALDPDTESRRSQFNAEDQWVRKAVPDLRIVSEESWAAVRVRQAGLSGGRRAGEEGTPADLPFWDQQRPVHLLSKLLRCGACGGGFSVISATNLGCSNRKNKGEATCTNGRTIQRELVEARVLEALGTTLMAPDVFASFVRGFTAAWNAEQKERTVEQEGQREELKRLARKIGNLVSVVGESGGSAAILAALKEAEARKAALEAELAVAEAPAPRLMPNLAEVYREKVATLQEALEGEDAAAARERIRALIAEVRLVPSPTDPKAPLTIEVGGNSRRYWR